MQTLLGFSTFDIYEITKKQLSKYFLEFVKFLKGCEYDDCTHIKEEKCGIKNAKESKLISSQRYNNYVKIYNDLKQKESRENYGGNK